MSNNNKGKLVLYHDEWCSHCKMYYPEWKAISKILNNNGIKTQEYEQTQNTEIMEQEGIKSFPTLKIKYENGDNQVLQSRDTNYILQTFGITANQLGGGKNKKNTQDPYYVKYLEYKMKYLTLKNEYINNN